jgi:Uma2 family endonuclease
MQNIKIDRSKKWTADDFLQLDESNTPCELINGQLFTCTSPSLLHQIILSNLYDVIKAHARKVNGFVAFAPFDVYLDEQNVFQPDLLYIQKDNLHRLTEQGVKGAPDLVVEILSPSTGFKDRNQKKNVFQKFGVKEFWIIDPGNRTLEIYDFKKDESPVLLIIETGTVTSALLPGLSFSFADLFNP